MPKVSGNCQLSNQLSSPFRGEWVQKFPPKDMWKLPTHVRQRIHSGPVPPPKAHRLPASTGKTAPPPSVPVVAAKWCNGCILKPKGGPPHPQAWEPRKPFFRPAIRNPLDPPSRKYRREVARRLDAAADAVSASNVDGHRFTIDLVAIDLSSFQGPMINSSSSRLSPSRG